MIHSLNSRIYETTRREKRAQGSVKARETRMHHRRSQIVVEAMSKLWGKCAFFSPYPNVCICVRTCKRRRKCTCQLEFCLNKRCADLLCHLCTMQKRIGEISQSREKKSKARVRRQLPFHILFPGQKGEVFFIRQMRHPRI